MQDEVRGEQGSARAGLVGRSLAFILSEGMNPVRFIRLDISGCCCVRQAVATRIVLNKYL